MAWSLSHVAIQTYSNGFKDKYKMAEGAQLPPALHVSRIMNSLVPRKPEDIEFAHFFVVTQIPSSPSKQDLRTQQENRHFKMLVLSTTCLGF